MTIKFKKANEDQLYQISGSNETLMKVAIIIHYGTEGAYHIFERVLEDGPLLYCPEASDRNNLVNRNFKKYTAEYSSEITDCINSIKKI